MLIEENLKWARIAASKYTLRAPVSSTAWSDAYSVACEALVKAAKRYDPAKGASFSTFAWPLMKRAIQKMRIKEKRHFSVESIAVSSLYAECVHGAEMEDAIGAERRSALLAECAPSPEDLLLEAEETARARERLARLPFAKRVRVEAVLDGVVVRGPIGAVKLAAQAGVRVPASAIPEKKKLTGAERQQRYHARLSAEVKLERSRTQEARRQAKAQAHQEAA